MTSVAQKSTIYLDNQSTTPVSAAVEAAMRPMLNETYGNPHSSDHWFGWQSKKKVDEARKKVAGFLHCDSDEVIFTSGATESNNLAILGALKHLENVGRRKIIVSAFEHKCVLECVKEAAKRGFTVEYLQPNREGLIQPDDLNRKIDATVGLVSIMAVNNEIGTLQRIPELAEIAHVKGALFHTDAAQAGIFLPLNVNRLGADLLSISAHKLYGPKGIGALYIRREIQNVISPLILGGGQENGFRSGTLPSMLCVGFGVACDLASQNREANIKHLLGLREGFLNSLSKRFSTFKINGSMESRHPGNLSLQFPCYDSHSVLQSLQPHLAISTGAACTTGTPEPSYVLRAIGLTDEEASSSLRISFGLQNSLYEVDEAVEYLVSALSDLAVSDDKNIGRGSAEPKYG